MTKVVLSKGFEKDLRRVPVFIKTKVIFWIELVESIGIREVRKYKGFHDEPLQGPRIGQRSVRLNIQYRLIYKELFNRVEILLLEVNKHEY